MSTIYTFRIDAPDIEVEAESPEEALTLAEDQLEHLSGSNTGSEYLANAGLISTGSYECRHEETVHRSHKVSRYLTPMGGKWEDLIFSYDVCKKCKKTLNETEVPLP